MTTTTEATHDIDVPASGHRARRSPRSARTRVATTVAVVAGVAILAAACSSTPSNSASSSTSGAGSNNGGGTTTSAGASNATVKTAQNSQFGTVLVNSSGMALYTFGGDHGGQSACTGACAQAWPAVTVPAGTTPTAGPGVTGTLGTSHQSNGTEQVTYNGALLYTFVSDSTPGQVTGNGVANFTVVKVSSSAGSGGGAGAATTTTPRGGGY